MLYIAFKSLRNRRLTAAMAILSISMSVALVLSVDKIRRDTKQSFSQTLSGTDLIVGARSGSIQLLLYSVFRIGDATNNISWQSVENIRTRKAVKWSIPLSLGDSHKGFRVLGTTQDYFKHYRYGSARKLKLHSGDVFDDVFDAVIGSEVATQLGYTLGQSVVIAHGIGRVALVAHDKQPFRISGVLAPTGTPIDRTVHVSLQGIEAMHVDWQRGMPVPGTESSIAEIRKMDLKPKAVTALLIGLRSRGSVFREQRFINEYRDEPLLAILPGVATQELWGLVAVAENALFVVSWCVVLAGLVNLVSVLFAGLNERRREMAILRALGASPLDVFLLLCCESAVLSLLGLLIGLILHYLLITAGMLWAQQQFGLDIVFSLPTTRDCAVLGTIFIAGVLAGCPPAWRAYRTSVSDGMMQRT